MVNLNRFVPRKFFERFAVKNAIQAFLVRHGEPECQANQRYRQEHPSGMVSGTQHHCNLKDKIVCADADAEGFLRRGGKATAPLLATVVEAKERGAKSGDSSCRLRRAPTVLLELSKLRAAPFTSGQRRQASRD